MEKPPSKLAKINACPKRPIELFQRLLEQVNEPLIVMNLANIDSEFGVLNRSVVFRGIVDQDCVSFITERNSRKYADLLANPKVSVTFYFGAVPPFDGTAAAGDDDATNVWQVRLFDAVASELNEDALTQLWSEQPLFARLRSHLCECGAPVVYDDHQRRHDQLLAEFANDESKFPRTATFTAFKIAANRWDFYKSGEQQVGDRLQYRRTGPEADEWQVMHVAA